MTAISSATRGSSPRTRRGRALIVGSSPALDRAAAMLVRPAVRVETLFDAVGEITVAPAAEPIAAVLLSAAALGAAAARILEAFRRLDPSVRLIAVADDPSQRAGLGQAVDRLDGTLVAPFTAAEAARVLEMDVAPDADRREPPSPAQAATVRSAPPPPAAPAPAPIAHSIPSPARSDAVPSEPSPVASPAAAPIESQPDEALGDTDLVEALLTNPEGVLAIAVRLIAQQTEWSDVAMIEGDAVPPHAAAREVTFNGRSFGSLATQFASTDELRPWADWLGKWLALDRAHRDYRAAAFRDDLTTAWNRRFFDTFLTQSIADAGRRRRPVTLMVFDIDDFKRYNDTFGHEAGDDILRETVKLMNSVIRKGDRVCRIGGDEFAVIFADPEGPRERGSAHPESVETIAKRFQDQVSQMKFPKLGRDAPGPLTISGGLATYPWDGLDPQSLLHHADQLALQSKRKGKNVITFGPGTQVGNIAP